MIWSELMAEARHRGMPRAELARHLKVEDSDLAAFERSSRHVWGEIQTRIRTLLWQHEQTVEADEGVPW